jgi:hypothetical protein
MPRVPRFQAAWDPESECFASMIVRFRLSLAPALLAVSLGMIVIAPGCGGDDVKFGQEFEKPADLPKFAEDPPDEGDDVHPRDR